MAFGGYVVWAWNNVLGNLSTRERVWILGVNTLIGGIAYLLWFIADWLPVAFYCLLVLPMTFTAASLWRALVGKGRANLRERLDLEERIHRAEDIHDSRARQWRD